MSQARMIRVMLVDDHDLLRGGIALLLQNYPDIRLIGEASNGVDAVALSSRLRPDVILMDLKMPEMDGTTATRLIRQQCPATQIVILSSYVDEDLVQTALSAGAISYLVKSCSIETLIAAIHDAAEGKAMLAREAAQALVNATQRPPAPPHTLTNREREVLALMTHGMNNTQIAAHLTISLSTAKKHVSNVLNKLNTTSRTEAVAFAVRNRLVADER
jgi:NarL family two-component system response regulator LiaR